MESYHPQQIEVRGARVNNLRGLDVDVPLDRLVAIAGVSGSGKSSLALGVLYAEGSRRYLEALSTYTRRRMSQAQKAKAEVTHIPPALALRQRPGVPGVRSTFGTMTELLNVLRLMFSRLASHRCPNGHYLKPSMKVAAEVEMKCPECGSTVTPPGAESLAFNSAGACPRCSGTAIVREVNDDAIVPDQSLSIDEGAVVPWRMFGWSVQPDIVREFGVRTDVPFSELTQEEREIVFAGPEEKKHITVTSVKGVHELDFTFRNARLTVTKELDRATDEKRLNRVSRFLTERVCPSCAGSRLSAEARAPKIGVWNLADATAMTLADLMDWVPTVSATLPDEMREMADALAATFVSMGKRLIQLGLGYLSLDRAATTLSTGERQRAQLARAVRNETTGVLYVLDEPSIGMHPANIEGLIGVMRDLQSGGNSVVFVDHDVQILRAADHLIELGPGAGSLGGNIVSQGSIEQVTTNENSLLSPFLNGEAEIVTRAQRTEFDEWLRLETQPIHTVHALDVRIPLGAMTAVTGVSGSGKTTLILDSLVPAINGNKPSHVSGIEPGSINKVRIVDATPIGINVRSTVATYSGVMDELRKAYAKTDEAKRCRLKAGAFSYNTGELRCPECDCTGQISLDVQFLPDVTISCPSCNGSRFVPEANEITIETADSQISLPQALELSVSEAAAAFAGTKMERKLKNLVELGLGYLKLGEDTPALSGGEAQRLKLAGEITKRQAGTLFVLDEPSVGLHPLDVRVLVGVLQRLIENDATVVVIEHDLDLIANCDYIVDMGPGGGARGGRAVATGTPDEVAQNPDSITGRYLSKTIGRNQ